MKNILILFILLLNSFLTFGGNLYIKTFGNQENPAILFLHGGPGYNCANFEITTAQALANQGYFVIVYDRRGEGRSTDEKAKYTFQETFDDMNTIYENYKLPKATLIGHSFGGIVGSLFAEKYPEKTSALVLVGAPISLQETFRTIIKTCKQIYQTKNDSVNFSYIELLEKMDTTTLEYSTYSFAHAMQNNFYRPKQPTDEAKTIYELFKTDSTLKKYTSKMTYQGPQGFWMNEKYTTLDLMGTIKTLLAKKVKVFGLYGKDDGLYSNDQVIKLQSIIGISNLRHLDRCSHSVFADQQTLFINSLKDWIR